MKKLIAIALTLMLMVSCGKATSEELIEYSQAEDQISVNNSDNESMESLSDNQISDDEIKTLLDFYIEYRHFTRGGPPHIDSEDFIELNGNEYYRVDDENYDTWAEWEAFIRSFYCGSLAEDALFNEHYTDVDGALYCANFAGQYSLSDDYIYEVLRNENGEAVIRVTLQDYMSPLNASVYTMTFSLTDDGWRIGYGF